MKSKFSSRFGR